jgi:hypothetical protein
MRRYNHIIAVFGVLLFFSGADVYLFSAGYTQVTPKLWIALFAALTVPLALHHLHCHQEFGRPLGRIVLWSLAYLAISVIWYILQPSEHGVQELRDRLLSVCFLTLIGFVLITPASRRIAAIAAIGVVIVTVAMNGIQLVDPNRFFMMVPTRASGLFGNANQCGAALVIGMTIGSSLVPRRFRPLFYLLIGAGVALTFSRSATLGWMIAAAVLLAFDSTSARARELVGGGLAAVMLVLILFQAGAASGMLDVSTLDNNLFDRVAFFTTFEVSDDAARQRREVAAKAWDLFADRPLEGNGLASTTEGNDQSASHNMFLALMADHGLVGAFILPALLIFVFLGRPLLGPGPHWAFCLFVLWYAFFSHNLLTERYQLLAFAFFAAGGIFGADALPETEHQASEAVVHTGGDAFASRVSAQ